MLALLFVILYSMTNYVLQSKFVSRLLADALHLSNNMVLVTVQISSCITGVHSVSPEEPCTISGGEIDSSGPCRLHTSPREVFFMGQSELL